MTEATPIFFPTGEHHAALVARIADLHRELRAETAGRACAEAEADEARELVRELQKRLHAEERVTRWLRRTLASRLLQGAAPFVVAGLAGGFGTIVLLRVAGW